MSSSCTGPHRHVPWAPPDHLEVPPAWHVLEQRVPAVAQPTEAAMHRLGRRNHGCSVYGSQCLVSQADAQHRHGGQVLQHVHAHPWGWEEAMREGHAHGALTCASQRVCIGLEPWLCNVCCIVFSGPSG